MLLRMTKSSNNKKNVMDERVLRKAIIRAEEEYSNDLYAEEAQHEAVEAASNLTVPIDDYQREILDKLTAWAENAKNKVDAKAQAILGWLENHLKPNGEWNNKRVILFTEYRATHIWLHQILTSNGYGGDRLMIIHGEVKSEDW